MPVELGQDKAQAIIDEITKAYECVGQAGFPPQYGYIPGIIPVAPIVNPPPYGGSAIPPNPLPPAGAPTTLPTQQPFGGQPPSSIFVRPMGPGTPSTLPFQPLQGAPASSGSVSQPEAPSPPSTGNVPTSLSPPGALPPPGASASFNAPGLPPQFPPGQPPR
ncbi:12001_t:CDS:2, partial [Racocetra fulgida]